MFWRIFNWKTDLQKNTLGNRAIMQILNIRLIYVFILMSVVYFFYGSQMLETSLGFVLLIGFLGFWIGRTIEQFIFLRVKSKMVTILTIVFMAGIVLHALPLV
jgi:hypothetical protein